MTSPIFAPSTNPSLPSQKSKRSKTSRMSAGIKVNERSSSLSGGWLWVGLVFNEEILSIAMNNLSLIIVIVMKYYYYYYYYYCNELLLLLLL